MQFDAYSLLSAGAQRRDGQNLRCSLLTRLIADQPPRCLLRSQPPPRYLPPPHSLSSPQPPPKPINIDPAFEGSTLRAWIRVENGGGGLRLGISNAGLSSGGSTSICISLTSVSCLSCQSAVLSIAGCLFTAEKPRRSEPVSPAG
jgi:hypothetical protein